MIAHCAHCRKYLEISDRYAGKSVRCTHCAGDLVAEPAVWPPSEPVALVIQAPPSTLGGPAVTEAPQQAKQDGLPPLAEKPDTSLLEGYAFFLLVVGCIVGFCLMVAGVIHETWVYALVGAVIIFATLLQHSAIHLFCRQSRELQAARQEIRWLIQQTAKSNQAG